MTLPKPKNASMWAQLAGRHQNPEKMAQELGCGRWGIGKNFAIERRIGM